ncbi:MAG: DUF1826 domain-containing protein [Pseudomonadota bacterium]
MLTRSTDRLAQSDVLETELPIAVMTDVETAGASFADDVDGEIWQRRIPERVSAWLNTLPVESLPEDRIVLRSEDVAACLIELFGAKGVGPCPALAWLSEDVCRLANWISVRAQAPFLRMRLEIVTNDACSKFHIDNVVARMICTYRGPGTQLATESTLDQDILSIPTGDPVLLKGKRWPQSTNIPLRHRSPPIAGTGLTRWLLVLEGCDRAEWMPEYDRPYRDLNLPEPK